MTERHAGYVVTLLEDLHEDEAALTMNALRMVKGVVSVVPVLAGHTYEGERANARWRRALLDLISDEAMKP